MCNFMWGKKLNYYLDLKSDSANTLVTINTAAFLLQHTCRLSVCMVLWEACGFPHPATAEVLGARARSPGAGSVATLFLLQQRVVSKIILLQ